MTTRYQSEHYEDVIRIMKPYMELRSEPDHFLVTERSAVTAGARAVVLDFADLFAADDPPSVYCGYCGTTEGNPSPILCPERGLDKVHSFVYHKGFDREQFLAACGLEEEG